MSTPGRPKQFADLFDEGSLFGGTLKRLAGLEGVAAPLVVAGSDHRQLIERIASDAGIRLEGIIVEPTGRNTAPAIAAAALTTTPDEVLVILPSDHLIRDGSRFQDHVKDAAGLAESGYLVTFGISPSRADTGYGYIEMGQQVGLAKKLVKFKEKPSSEEAEILVSDGNHLWNSGMFVARAATVVSEMATWCPDILEAVDAALPEGFGEVRILGSDFSGAAKTSFDHAVMEHTDLGVVIPMDVGWDDIGSYQALWEVSDKDDMGNVISGRVVVSDVSGSYIRANSRTVAVAGLSDVVVVGTEDGVLVIPRERSQEVRDLVDRVGEVED